MANFELNLLGGFELLAVDGAPISLPSKKARALLAYLACHPDQEVPRAKAAALLWGDRGDEQARGSLRQTLTVLRKALHHPEGDVLHITTAGIALDEILCVTDLSRFEAGAIEAYKGALLDGFDLREPAFDDWLREQRSRLVERAVCKLAAQIDRAEKQGDPIAAIAHVTALLHIDPLREDMQRVAMRLQQAQGHWTEALKQYHAFEAVLEAELAVTPDAKTVALFEEILAARDNAGTTRSTKSLMPWSAAPPKEAGRPSIAVMPFDNLGDDTEQGYFADGITEDIITNLSRFPELIVIAHNSTFTFKDKSFALRDIRDAFAVEYLVKGSVRKLGNRIRLTAQLIEADSAKHAWAQRYDRELVDIFALQDELTQGIVGVLPGRIADSEARKIARKPPEDMVAYELLLAAKVHHHRHTKTDCIKALDLLDRALALVPDYAAAYAWKACLFGQALARGFMPNPQALYQGAVESCSMALKLDQNEVEAHRVQGEISIVNKRLDLAEMHNERALTLNPNDPRLLAQKGELLIWNGLAQEAIDWIRMAMRLDPYWSPAWAHLLGLALMMAGDYTEAVEAYKKCAVSRVAHHADAAACHSALGNDQGASKEAAIALELQADFKIDPYTDGLPYAHNDDRVRHRQLLAAAFPV